MDQQIRDLLTQGIGALRAGDRATARRYLLELTYRAPTYQDGWLWLSDTTDDPQEQRAYIERVLALDSHSRAGQIATKKLARLSRGTGVASPPPALPAVPPAAPAAPPPMSSFGAPAPAAPDGGYHPYAPPPAPAASSYNPPAPAAPDGGYRPYAPPPARSPTFAISNSNSTPAGNTGSTVPMSAAGSGETTPPVSLPLLLALGGAALLLLLLLGGAFWLGTLFTRQQPLVASAEELLIRFQSEGLEAVNPQPVTEADYPSGEMFCAATSRRVDLPTYGAAARIFVCGSERQVQRLREQFATLTADTPTTGMPRLYTRNNVLLQIDPAVPPPTAAQYAATLVEVLPETTPAPAVEATVPPAVGAAVVPPYPVAQGNDSSYPAPSGAGGYPQPFVPTAPPPPTPTVEPVPTAPPFDEEALIATEIAPEAIPTATPEVPPVIFPEEPPPTEEPTPEPLDAKPPAEPFAPPPEEPPAPPEPAPPAPPASGELQPLPQAAPPLVFNGTGVLETGLFRLPAPVSRVQIQHDGKGRFVVRRLTPNDPIGERLVDTEGVYSGSLLQRANPGVEQQDYFYAVEADGNWTLVLEAVPEASPPGDIVVGSGDFVSDFFVPTDDLRRDYNIRHSKDAPIQIFAHCNNGTEEILILDAAGVLDTIESIQLGPPRCLWEVLAATDGEWTLEKLP